MPLSTITRANLLVVPVSGNVVRAFAWVEGARR
jgi:hypothetical protein